MSLTAKQQLKAFLTAALQAKDHRYTFTLDMDVNKAHQFIHNMRMAMSRLRNRLRDGGKQLRQFKMIVISCEPNKDAAILNPHTIITLEYRHSNINALSRDLTELFTILTDDTETIDDRVVRGQVLTQPGIPYVKTS